MSNADEIEQLLTEVSSAFGLSRSARRDLFQYWQSNFEHTSLNLSGIVVNADFRHRVAELASIWSGGLENRRLPARARGRSSQIFLFDTIVRYLLVHHHLSEEEFELWHFPDEPHVHKFRTATLESVRRARPIEAGAARRVQWLLPSPETKQFYDEDAETRVVLNQISLAFENVSQELASSNDRMENILSRMEIAEANNTKLETSRGGDHGSTQGNP